MKKAAVIFADGCEEGEALTIVDIMRRAELSCDIVGLNSDVITGDHGIVMKADKVLSEETAEYDMIVLPGGYKGRDEMLKSEVLKNVIVKMNDEGKYVCAICAAPEVLDQAGVLEGKNYTCYPTVKDRVHHGTYVDETVVVDGNVVTGLGPALAYAFAYKLTDLLGGDALTVQKRMVYFNAFDVKEGA